VPDPFPGGEIHLVPGDHSLKKDPAGVAALVLTWCRSHGWAR
jgi:hypothetical protein